MSNFLMNGDVRFSAFPKHVVRDDVEARKSTVAPS